MQTYIVHYGELGLKGQNRPQFEKRLAHNMRVALRDLGQVKVQLYRGYMAVGVADEAPPERVEQRLTGVFGIAYFAPALAVPQELEAITEAALHLARRAITPETSFKVQARRADKRFPVTSMDLNRELGARIVDEIGAPVRLHDPAVTLHVQIYPEKVYLFTRRIPGPGGLPVGTAGRVTMLLSGGIDSPVAAHLMLKRGCAVDFVHFHMLRNETEIRASKVIALARAVLSPHRLPAVVYMLPSQPFQMALLEYDSRVELVAFRRFIMQVAERIAQRRKSLALVTGDNLGQVASQTLENLCVTSRAVETPILRPLISFDKQEIVEVAQRIGTYELSIQPYQDPCSLHAHHPATRAKLAVVEELEAKIGVESLIEETLAQTEEIWINFARSNP